MAQEQDESNIQFARLTATEKACLNLVQAGKTSKEIAREVGLTPYSVDSAIRDACAKIGTRSRVMAAQMLAQALNTSAQVTVTSADPNFGPQVQSLSEPTRPLDNETSAGEGNGPDDLEMSLAMRRGAKETLNSSGSSGKLGPLATFLRGQNQLSKLRRLLIIIVTAVAIVIAYGGIIDGLREVSRLVGL